MSSTDSGITSDSCCSSTAVSDMSGSIAGQHAVALRHKRRREDDCEDDCEDDRKDDRKDDRANHSEDREDDREDREANRDWKTRIQSRFQGHDDTIYCHARQLQHLLERLDAVTETSHTLMSLVTSLNAELAQAHAELYQLKRCKLNT